MKLPGGGVGAARGDERRRPCMRVCVRGWVRGCGRAGGAGGVGRRCREAESCEAGGERARFGWVFLRDLWGGSRFPATKYYVTGSGGEAARQ